MTANGKNGGQPHDICEAPPWKKTRSRLRAFARKADERVSAPQMRRSARPIASCQNLSGDRFCCCRFDRACARVGGGDAAACQRRNGAIMWFLAINRWVSGIMLRLLMRSGNVRPKKLALGLSVCGGQGRRAF
jgi:hypothetical protein